MTDIPIIEENQNKSTKRPVFLLVLIILSGINIGSTTLASLGGIFGIKPDQDTIKDTKLEFARMREQLQEADAQDYMYLVDQMEQVTLNMFDNFQAYNSVQFIFLMLGLLGILLMYRAKKLGFHLYILYSLGLVMLPYFFNPMSGIPSILTIFGVIYGGVWVLMYGRNLHWLQD
jgi:hypothetical protein